MLDPAIAAAFDDFAPNTQKQLMALRSLIFEAAAELEVGPLTETLKWGQPAYFTDASKSGTTIRLGTAKAQPDICALLVHCQTTLVTEFREVLDHPAISFEGNRAVLFPAAEPLPEEPLTHCIVQALTYKLR